MAGGGEDAKSMARAARAASRAMQSLGAEQRTAALHAVAAALEANVGVILEANAQDLAAAEGAEMSAAMKQRLVLKEAKVMHLANAVRALADQEDMLAASVTRRMEVAEGGLVLEKKLCPIGVLLIIFESRPDALVQIAALAIKSGNGLLLKGGKEAAHSNAALHRIVTEAAEPHGIPKGAIGLVTRRDEVSDLLGLTDCIDLIIPRGSNALVKHIQQNTSIPVLGHADGICHIYLHADADADKAVRIAVDSKCDYPAACNAVETILVHEALVGGGEAAASRVAGALKSSGVEIFAGPRAKAAMPDLPALEHSMHHEYGAMQVTLELVSSQQEAVDHIHRHGSGHTECIVTEDGSAAEAFLSAVDSACVFHNASTRFSDGFRFGLGAEVGISTGRIHARGPVGVDGLLTTKWVMRGDGHAVQKDRGVKYVHKKLPL